MEGEVFLIFGVALGLEVVKVVAGEVSVRGGEKEYRVYLEDEASDWSEGA
jgi:hypothetical protein